MMNSTLFACLAIMGSLLLLTSTPATGSSIYRYQQYPSLEDQANRIWESLILNDLMRSSDAANSKRGLDFGMGRGFSGSQAAKHLVGLAAANFAGGPGKKKRSMESEAEDN